MMNDMPKKKRGNELDSPLARAFRFTLADLQDNQQGFISRRQKRHLITVLIIATGFIVFVCLGLFSVWIDLLRNPENNWFYKAIMTLLLLGLGAGMTGASWVSWGPLRADLRANRVETLEGMVKPLSYTPARAKNDYFITIDEQPLRVTVKQQQIFEDALSYRLYFAPKSRKILSAEIISGNQDEN
jgi:hypothetical protein